MKKTRVLSCFIFAILICASFLFVGCVKEQEICTITLTSANETYGNVYGSGDYTKGENITIVALSKEGYKFSHWSDESTNNIRQIKIEEDLKTSESLQTALDVLIKKLNL